MKPEVLRCSRKYDFGQYAKEITLQRRHENLEVATYESFHSTRRLRDSIPVASVLEGQAVFDNVERDVRIDQKVATLLR